MRFVARALGAVLAVLCLWGAAGAEARPIGYTASVTFFDGGTALGHFTFDADTVTYTNVSITISGSSTPSLDGTYTYLCPNVDCGIDQFHPADAGNLLVLAGPATSDNSDQRAIDLTFTTPLSDADTSSTGEATYGTCSVSNCQGIQTDGDERIALTLIVTGTPVPTLTAWSLAAFSLLLAGVATLRLRRTVSA